MSAIVLRLRRENGKTITVDQSANGVSLIVWAKSGAPKLPLDLTIAEATGLCTLLAAAIAKATGGAA
jgi:hypothetical protein